MIVLDTNIVSETMRADPDKAVIAWLNAQPADDLFLCTPVLAELNHGVARLGHSRRKTRLGELFRGMVFETFEGRILSFDAEAAETYGVMLAKREAAGAPISTIDAMIAAIAQGHRATLATRNVSDFGGLGLELFNPFRS